MGSELRLEPWFSNKSSHPSVSLVIMQTKQTSPVLPDPLARASCNGGKKDKVRGKARGHLRPSPGFRLSVTLPQASADHGRLVQAEPETQKAIKEPKQSVKIPLHLR